MLQFIEIFQQAIVIRSQITDFYEKNVELMIQF